MTRQRLQRATFVALARHGRRITDGPMRATHLGPDHAASVDGPSLVLAFSLSRRFGSAVERNRARRRLRAAFTEAARSPSLDAAGVTVAAPRGVLLLGARREVLTIPYDELVAGARRMCRRLSDESGTLSR